MTSSKVSSYNVVIAPVILNSLISPNTETIQVPTMATPTNGDIGAISADNSPTTVPTVTDVSISQNLSDELMSVSATLKKVSAMVQLLAREIIIMKKKAHKFEADKAKADKKRLNRRTGNSNGLRQENPVIRDEFSDFVKSNTELKGKDGSIIVTTIKYDANGKLLLNRAAALRLVTSYIKANMLQKFPEDRKCIMMDDTLQKVLVETGVMKIVGDTSVRVCFYKDIMGGLNKNFASKKNMGK